MNLNRISEVGESMILIPALRDEPASGRGALAKSRCGRIVRCECCDEIEIAFGNAVFHVDEIGLLELGRAIEVLEASDPEPGDRRPYLLRPSRGYALAFGFSAGELSDLGRLVMRAIRALDAEPGPIEGSWYSSLPGGEA